jgi:hypothetical protein
MRFDAMFCRLTQVLVFLTASADACAFAQGDASGGGQSQRRGNNESSSIALGLFHSAKGRQSSALRCWPCGSLISTLTPTPAPTCTRYVKTRNIPSA